MKDKNKNSKNEFFLSQWIEGELTDTELKSLVSEKDYLAYKKLKNGLHIYSELESPLDNSFSQIQNRIQNKSKVRTLNYKWIASIAAILVFFMGFYSLLNNDAVLNVSDFGEHKTIALLDGSEVVLNAKSALNYSKKDWKNKREMYLSGEAFFKVKKGSQFTVKTKNGTITVLGTQFNIKTTKDFFEVICYEGKVRVTYQNKEYILNPADVFRKINGNRIENLRVTNKLPTWVLGESSYRSVPLRYVIADFEKQFNLKIDAKNIDSTMIYTGSFNHANIDIALKSVFTALQIKTKKIKNNILVLE